MDVQLLRKKTIKFVFTWCDRYLHISNSGELLTIYKLNLSGVITKAISTSYDNQEFGRNEVTGQYVNDLTYFSIIFHLMHNNVTRFIISEVELFSYIRG